MSTKTKTAKKSKTTKAVSKKAQAIKIINQMFKRKNEPTRQEVLAEMQKKIPKMSLACAKTYYQNIVNGDWAEA